MGLVDHFNQYAKDVLDIISLDNGDYIFDIGSNDGVGLTYNGSSMVINPLGEVLLQTDKKTEYASCNIDTSMVSKTRKNFPFLEDIRFI